LPSQEPCQQLLVHNPYNFSRVVALHRAQGPIDVPLRLSIVQWALTRTSVLPAFQAHLFRDLQFPASSSCDPDFGRLRRPRSPPCGPTVRPLTNPSVPFDHKVAVASSTAPLPLLPLLTPVASGGAEEVYPIGWHDNVPISVTRKGPPQPPPLPRATPIASILQQYQDATQAP
jgi:hypothetical protein